MKAASADDGIVTVVETERSRATTILHYHTWLALSLYLTICRTAMLVLFYNFFLYFHGSLLFYVSYLLSIIYLGIRAVNYIYIYKSFCSIHCNVNVIIILGTWAANKLCL